jgi:hypothetical protein
MKTTQSLVWLISCLLALLLVIILPGCGQDNNNGQMTAKFALYKNAKTFDDIFILKKKIELQECQDNLLGTVNTVLVDSLNNIYILDWKSIQVFVFDKSGSCIRTIGKKGYGPGEYGFCNALCYRNGSIFIADVRQRKIHQFSSAGAYVSSCKMVSYNCYDLFVDQNLHLYTYDPVVSGDFEKLIIVQNCAEPLFKFGEPTILAKKFFPCPTHGFAVDSRNFIYQVNSHEYKIYKYNNQGQLLAVFSNDHSISKCRSLPANMLLERTNDEKKVKRIALSFDWINNLKIINDEILAVCYSDGSSPGNRMDLLDLNGNFIKATLELPYELKTTYKNDVYLVEEPTMDNLDKPGHYVLHMYSLRSVPQQ